MNADKKKIAVIGCGALAHVFVQAAAQTLSEDYTICGFLGRDPGHARQIADSCGAAVYSSAEEMLKDAPDYVLELAGGPAVRAYGEKILLSGVCFLVASIGALSDEKLRDSLTEAARAGRSKMYIISGAVGAFDVLQTISMMAPLTSEIRNEKPPRGLEGAPYLESHPLNSEEEYTVFEGSVPEAIAGFPKNVNVAVASSLAAADPGMKVIIRSIPGQTVNRHVIRASNDFVRMELSLESSPDPSNPRSSTMTAWSAAALLKNLASPVMYY